ncbi:MAG TPA: molecular chaperone TorD family protein [Candidatus Acidoferrales bacterium]|nr:molecular chaperone TorD family protein [Candidatus Acidoferrales bacterium]
MREPAQSATQVERAWVEVDLYRFFAQALGAPTAERFEWFQQPNFAAGLADLWVEVGTDGNFPGFDFFTAPEEYEATYIALFDVGVPEPPVPLFESAHYRSLPAQQVALENTSFYEVLGLKTDPARSVPDHLLTQLEFLSVVRYLREHAPDEPTRRTLAQLEKDFLERHLLNWLPVAVQKLERHEVPAFSILFSLLLAHLNQQYRLLANSPLP